MAQILVVDDEELVRWSLRERLQAGQHTVVEAETAHETVERFEQGVVDLVLLDLGLPDRSGLELLRDLRARDPNVPVVVITAHSTVETAVEAMRQGAYHYVTKPFNLVEVGALVEEALAATALGREARTVSAQDRATFGFDDLVGESPAMRDVKALLRKVAESPASTVLLTGESGTGKDIAAHVIHAHSARARAPFMNITCSALPEALLESELFGHERGAFTDARAQKKGLLELADGGTVFLDEIAEMTPTLQAKLLRFLEEKAFRRVGGSKDVRPDVRVVAATHRDLQADIETGRFRGDLFYRLAVLSVRLPPLRERPGDVELLARRFVDKFNKELGRRVRSIAPEALSALAAQPWPGNVRELRNVVERAVLLCEGERLGLEACRHACPPTPTRASDIHLPAGGLCLRDLERELTVQALERASGNQTRAAELLGLSRDQIRYRIAKFGLDLPLARAGHSTPS